MMLNNSQFTIRKKQAAPPDGKTAILARLCMFIQSVALGLRGQPIYDRNGVTSLIARFRHPLMTDQGSCRMPLLA